MAVGISILLVAVQVAVAVPPSAPEAAEARVVASCASVLGADACVAATAAVDPTFVAEVQWEGRRLTVTFRKPDPEGTLVARTELDFSSQDTDEERWEAAGLMVAALAAAQPRAIVEAPPPPPPPPPRVAPEVPPPPPAPKPRLRWALELGAVGGNGLDAGPLRWGGEARLLGIGPRSHLILPLIAASASARSGEPSVLWLEGATGLGWRPTAPESRVAVDLWSAGVVQLVQASATEGAATSRAEAVRGGGRVGFTVSLPMGRSLAFWAGGQATYIRPALEVRERGDTVGLEGPLRVAAGAGLRFELGSGRL